MSIRADLDQGYEFPQKMPLEKKLKDVLEDDVDEKYYLSEEQVERLTTTAFNSAKADVRVQDKNGESRTILARDYKDPKLVPTDISKTVRTSGRSSLDRHSWDVVCQE